MNVLLLIAHYDMIIVVGFKIYSLNCLRVFQTRNLKANGPPLKGEFIGKIYNWHLSFTISLSPLYRLYWKQYPDAAVAALLLMTVSLNVCSIYYSFNGMIKPPPDSLHGESTKDAEKRENPI